MSCWLISLRSVQIMSLIQRVAAFRMHNESIPSGFHGQEQDLKFHNDLNRIHNKLFSFGQHIPLKALGLFRRLKNICERQRLSRSSFMIKF